MRPWLVLVIALYIIVPTTYGQNLVINPSFECGEDFCGPFQSRQSTDYDKYACGWSVPTDGTTDAYSTKLTTPECFTAMPYRGNPHATTGDQLPRTGDRFAGFVGLITQYVYPDSNYREYLEGKLMKPLVPGDIYCAEMYVSRADFCELACANLGMRFNKGSYFQSWYHTIKLDPQVYEPAIIEESENWYRVGGTFTATEASDHFIIGNFLEDYQTPWKYIRPVKFELYGAAYYYVDDVSVEKLPNDQFQYAGDTSICVGDKTMLRADAGTEFVDWEIVGKPGVVHTGIEFEITPERTTTYVTTARGCSKEIRDSLTVFVHPKVVLDIGPDTTMCAGTRLRISAGKGFDSYKWQDQSTQESITVDKAGTYSVTVMNGLECLAHDERIISVTPLPVVDLGSDVLVCSEEYPVLHAGKGYDEYNWSSGVMDSVYTPNTPGEYEVTVRSECGHTSDKIIIYSAKDIMLPNVLTLNGDGFNERLKLVPEVTNGMGSITIFNRWGERLFRDDKYEGQWPVTPDEMNPGTYYYIYQVVGCPPIKGFVEVIK